MPSIQIVVVDDFTSYTGEQPAGGFYQWLRKVNKLCVSKVGLGIFDLADYNWRDEYDAGSDPKSALAAFAEWDDSGLAELLDGEDE